VGNNGYNHHLVSLVYVENDNKEIAPTSRLKGQNNEEFSA
jgi:hypothetical protein